MDLRHLRIDSYLFGALVLAATTLGFVVAQNGAATVMGAMCIGGLIAGRLAGAPNRALVPLAFGLAAILWMVWIEPPAGPRRTTTLAHFAGGALVGWGLAEWMRGRLASSAWPLAAAAGVVVAAVLWEVAEWRADTWLGTGMVPSLRDSVLDVGFGALGGVVGIAISWLLLRRRAG